MASSSRRISRELALQMLFQYEFAPNIELDGFVELFESNHSKDAVAFAKILVEGTRANVKAIDEKITAASRSWKMDRMPAVDRCLLRMCVFEMLFAAEPLPPGIAIDEAVEIARRFSTQDSASFVNGVLDAIAKSSNF